MSELYTIFSARCGGINQKDVAATERGFQSENEKAQEVQQIVADLAKNKTSWLNEPHNARDYVRGWAGLR